MSVSWLNDTLLWPATERRFMVMAALLNKSDLDKSASRHWPPQAIRTLSGIPARVILFKARSMARSLQDHECGDLILTTAKSSIYSTKRVHPTSVASGNSRTNGLNFMEQSPHSNRGFTVRRLNGAFYKKSDRHLRIKSISTCKAYFSVTGLEGQ